MHYVSESRPNPAGWLRRALREILFVFAPGCTLLIYAIIEINQNPKYREPGTELVMALVVGIPSALVLWTLYRIIRFAIGR